MPDDGRFPIGAEVTLDELSTDPYPVYARLRDSEPVSFVPALNMYFVTRHDDVRAVMQDDKHFVVGTEKSVIHDIFGRHMMTVEGDAHERYKSAHQRFFLPPSVKASLEPSITVHANRLIDGFADDGEVELRSAFASRLPVLTMLTLFGLDAGEERQLRHWYDDFEVALANFTWDENIRARGHASAAEFRQLIQQYIDRARTENVADPGSLLGALLGAPPDERLSDEEIQHNALIIFFGGISTVDALILNTLYALGLNPDQFERVRNDVSLLPKAITETIRWLGPVQSATRHAADDTLLFGEQIRAGDTVNCMLGAANRDPDVFDDPDSFDLDRDNAQRHVGFATGPHHCLGSHLARAEARIGIECLLNKWPGLQIDIDQSAAPTGHEFRQPATLFATAN